MSLHDTEKKGDNPVSFKIESLSNSQECRFDKLLIQFKTRLLIVADHAFTMRDTKVLYGLSPRAHVARKLGTLE